MKRILNVKTVDTFTRNPTFLIRAGRDAGKVLEAGMWFRFFGGEEQFKFKSHSISRTGSESVDAFGGMPGKGASEGDSYMHRAFRCDMEFLIEPKPKGVKRGG